MIDSHCHLSYDEINLEEALNNAKQEGIEYFLTVSTKFNDIKKNIYIAETHNNVVCSIGVHPINFYDGYDLNEMKQLAKNPKVVAIGEVGLEYHYEGVPHSYQKKMFRDMLGLAQETKLPVILHLRECFDDELFEILGDYSIDAVFHCYSDSLLNAKRIINSGYYISFSGIVTFKKCDELREVAKYVPEDRFLIETDCPFLAPVPLRVKTNEPKFLKYIAECIAKERNITIEHLSEITNENFFRLFSKASNRLK